MLKNVQVRDKEEELENSLQKIDNLRQDIRKAEKLRRELEVNKVFFIDNLRHDPQGGETDESQR
jgi:hypothetical protein